MDARQERTLTRLSETILQLASAGPVSELTVSGVAAAGIHRSTFYTYATSPAELLVRVLRTELDALRTEYLVGVAPSDVASAVTGVTRAVLRHVYEHDGIYRRGLGAEPGAGGASLHRMLSEHFQGSIELLLAQHSVSVPARDDIDREVIARYLADGIIGAIDVWLTRPRPRDVDAFLALVGRLTPSWWPG